METPDSIHLASAILYEAEVFYTFDGEGKKKRPTRAKLLSLSGDVAGIMARCSITRQRIVIQAVPSVRNWNVVTTNNHRLAGRCQFVAHEQLHDR